MGVPCSSIFVAIYDGSGLRGGIKMIRLMIAFTMLGFNGLVQASSVQPNLTPGAGVQVAGESAEASGRRAQPRVIKDDRGKPLPSEARARRVVALAPHLTDLVIALGAVERLVAVDRHSDAPQLNHALPRLASHPAIDPERVLALKPDLVLLWGEGLAVGTLARLEALGLRVFVSQPRTLDDVADSLERIGALVDTESAPQALAAAFRSRLAAITARHSRTPEIPVFVQLWESPLITLGARSVMTDALRRCGVRNVLAVPDAGSQRVSPEAVLAAAPRLILSTVKGSTDLRWRQLGLAGTHPNAARFIRLDEAALERPSPPVLESLARVCSVIDEAVPRAH